MVYDVEPMERANFTTVAHCGCMDGFARVGWSTWNRQGRSWEHLQQDVQLELPDANDANPEIERMWAWYRVDRLMEEREASRRFTTADEIVTLCEEFSIVSEYASFIVLENDAEYQRWNIERRNLARFARPSCSAARQPAVGSTT